MLGAAEGWALCTDTTSRLNEAQRQQFAHSTSPVAVPGGCRGSPEGLRHSLPGARIWRQVWSNHLLKDRPAREVHALAMQAYASAAPEQHTEPGALAAATT